MRTIKNLFSFLSALLLLACISPAERVKYYSLSLEEDSEAPSYATSDSLSQEKPQIVIESISLPTFLRQDKLVMQIGAHEIYSANFHRWAEPLEEAIAKVLVQALSRKNTGYQFDKTSPQWRKSAQLNLRLEFEKFHATDTAKILVSGRYWLYDTRSNLKSMQVFNFTDTLTHDGYLHTVEKLQHAIDQLSDKIAQSLNQFTVKQSKS